VKFETRLDVKTILTPVQIYTRGEMVPAYGYLVHNDRAKAFSSVDFVTGNISETAGWSSAYGELCTGDFNRRTLTGWYTMSKCNLNSMYFSQIVRKDTWFEATKAALDIDKMILQGQEEPLFCLDQ
jgi:hypothetical protein